MGDCEQNVNPLFWKKGLKRVSSLSLFFCSHPTTTLMRRALPPCCPPDSRWLSDRLPPTNTISFAIALPSLWIELLLDNNNNRRWWWRGGGDCPPQRQHGGAREDQSRVWISLEGQHYCNLRRGQRLHVAEGGIKGGAHYSWRDAHQHGKVGAVVVVGWIASSLSASQGPPLDSDRDGHVGPSSPRLGSVLCRYGASLGGSLCNTSKMYVRWVWLTSHESETAQKAQATR